MNMRDKSCYLKPELRFPEFQEQWKMEQLGDFATTVSGLTYSPKDISENGIIVLRSSNVQAGKIVLDDVVRVAVEKGAYNALLFGDILVCVRNGSRKLIGKCAKIPRQLEGSAFGAFMLVVRSQESGFVYQLLNTAAYKRQVDADLGARINSINSGQLRKYRFCTPSLPEQKKIADFLGAVDDKIAKLTEKKALLERYKKGVMQKLFSQSLRFKGFDEEWKLTKLGSCTIKVGSGVTPKGGAASYVENGIPLLRSQNIRGGKLDTTEVAYVTADVHASMSSSRVLPGDVLLNITGASIGRSCIFPKELGEANVNQHVCIIRTNSDLNSEFLQQTLASHVGKKLIFQAQAGGGREGLNFENIRHFKLRLPHPAEQRKIADFLNAIDDKINHVSDELEQAKLFKKGLLQQMFV